jgi:biopolymer transport protein ExbB
MNIQRTINTLAQMGTEWVLWLLAGLSVAALAIILERTILMLLTCDNFEKLQKELRSSLAVGRVDEARRRLECSRSYEARIVVAGLFSESPKSAEERMVGESQLARLEMERSLTYLGTLGNNAPFIGLLGTVIGIVGAFHELGSHVGQVSAGLMSQIGEALIATAIGLFVALPSVATYNVFQRVIATRLSRAEALGHDVIAYYRSYMESEAVRQRVIAAE